MSLFGLVVIIIAIVILISGFGLRQSAIKYDRESTRTRGTIVKYYQNDNQSRWETPVVRIMIGDKEAEGYCRAVKMNEDICSIGTEVAVSYVETTRFGKPYYKMRIEEDAHRPMSSALFGSGIIVFGVAMSGLGVFMMVSGL